MRKIVKTKQADNHNSEWLISWINLVWTNCHGTKATKQVQHCCCCYQINRTTQWM